MRSNCGAAEDSWESLGQQRDQTVTLKGSQLWIHIGRTDAEAEAPVFWPPYVNNQLIGKVPDIGKDWGQKEKRASEDEMTEWHHWYSGHELGQTPGDDEGQGGLACCNPQGHKQSDMTRRLSNNNIAFVRTTLSEHCSVVSDSLRPYGLYSSWNSPGQNTGVGSHSFLQGIFPRILKYNLPIEKNQLYRIHREVWPLPQSILKGFHHPGAFLEYCYPGTNFPGGSVVKSLPAMQESQETRVQSLGWEDPPEKEMAIHSSMLAWKIPWIEEPVRLQSKGSQRTGHEWATEHACMHWGTNLFQGSQPLFPLNISLISRQTLRYFLSKGICL